MKIIKCDTHTNAAIFSIYFKYFSDHTIPPLYFCNADTYLFIDRYKLPIGGFSLQHSFTYKRAINQLPSHIKPTQKLLKYLKHGQITEANGLFIFQKNKAIVMLLFGLWKIFIDPSKYFIFAYDKNNEKLKKIYSFANGHKIYSGLVENQEGMEGEHYEDVLIITKFGFVRLFVSWLFRRIKKIVIKR